MKSRTAGRIALVLILIAGGLAVAAAVYGNSLVFAAMAMLVLGQALSLRALRRRRKKAGAAPTKSA